jgi:hypothetical protein
MDDFLFVHPFEIFHPNFIQILQMDEQMKKLKLKCWQVWIGVKHVP